MFSKDISPKINGKLKDECAYIVGLMERIISSAAYEKPSEETIKNDTFFYDDELVQLELLKPQVSGLVDTYLKLCK